MLVLSCRSTRWLWLVHDDDELYPDSIGKVQSFLAGCGNAAIVLGGLEYIDPQGRTLGKWIPKMSGTFRGEEGLLAWAWILVRSHRAPYSQSRRVVQSGGFVEIDGVCADYPFSVRLAFSYGVAFLPELVGRFRMGHRQSYRLFYP